MIKGFWVFVLGSEQGSERSEVSEGSISFSKSSVRYYSTSSRETYYYFTPKGKNVSIYKNLD